MSQTDDKLENLKEHRDAILLAEIGALIHDLGKLSEEFVLSKCNGELAKLYSWYAHQYILGRVYLLSGKEKIVNFKDSSGVNRNFSVEDLKLILNETHYQIELDKVKSSIKKLFGIDVSNKQINKNILPVLKELNRELKTTHVVNINFRLSNVLNSLSINILKEKCSVGDIVSCHHNGKKQEIYSIIYQPSSKIIRLFQRSADGIDSGIDKGTTLDSNKQSIDDIFISTSFGYEFEKIYINSNPLKVYRSKFIKVLEKVLPQIQNLLSKKDAEKRLIQWLKLRRELIEAARKYFIHGLGETRRSANDVTLWDHSSSAASLFKSALAGILISGKWNDPSKIKWRLFSIRFNGFDYITKGIKVGDLLGRRDRIELALDLIKNLLEVYVPIGNEVYRDENGSVFLVPDIENLGKFELPEDIYLVIKNEKIIENFNLIKEFREGKRKPDIEIKISKSTIIENAVYIIFNKLTCGELKPVIDLSNPSRGAVNLGKVLEKSVFNRVFVNSIKKTWDGVRAPVCNLCGLKPCKKKEKGKGHYDFCEDCLKIRRKRAEKWYNNRIVYKSTIWIDEICDKNRRAGVIVGAFDLNNWLNGIWLNTVFTKILEDLQNSEYNIFYQIKTWDDLIKAVAEAIEKNVPDTDLSLKKADGTPVKVKELLKAIGGESYRGQKVEDYFNAIVKDRESDVIKWAYEINDIDALSKEEKAKLLILALFRKNPSFARIRRIWETTKRFWDEIENKLKRVVNTRERYKLVLSRKISLEPNRAYELRVGGHRIPVFYPKQDNKRTELLIVESWKELKIDLEQLKELLHKNKFEIWEPSDYGTKSTKKFPKDNEQLDISVEIEKDSEYYPYIQVLKEPGTFVVLVPLDKSWDILKIIKKEYEIQFSKVQNRLPIKLGLVAFKRKYPLYVVMDAVKRLVNEKIKENVFEVLDKKRLETVENCEKFDGRLGNYALVFNIGNKNRKFKFKFYISYSLGDPDKEDWFYPYFVVVNPNGSRCADLKTKLYKKYFKKSIGTTDVLLRHALKLEIGDKIIFEPSLFDFEFLDSNIRRFDIGEERKHWLFTDSNNKPKPYLLWDIDNFEKLRRIIQKLRLTTTQIMNLYEMLISKIEDWGLKGVEDLKDDAFEKLVENAIKSAPLRLKVVDGESGKGKISKQDFEFLKAAILNGMFFDFVDLWHTILKKKFEEGEKND